PSASQAAVSGSSAPMSAMYASELGSTGSSSIRVFQGLFHGKMVTFAGGGGGGGGGGGAGGEAASGAGGGAPAWGPPSGAGAGSPASGRASPPSSPPSPPSGVSAGNKSPASRASGPGCPVGPDVRTGMASKKLTPLPLHPTRAATRTSVRVRMGRGPYPVTREARAPVGGPGQCVTPRQGVRPEGVPPRERLSGRRPARRSTTREAQPRARHARAPPRSGGSPGR